MKKIISILLCLAMVLSFALVVSAESTSATLLAKDLGLENGTEFASAAIGQCDFAANKGTSNNGPKYYTTGEGIRFYNGNELTFTPKSGYSVSKIEFVCASSYNIAFSSENKNVYQVNTDGTTVTVVPSSVNDAVTLYPNNTSRVQKIIVTYDVASTTVVEVTGVTVDPATVSTSVGETVTLTASVSPADATSKAITWSTENNDIVALDTASGTFIALKAGTATITATAANGVSGNCVITVSEAAQTAKKVNNLSALKAGHQIILVNEVHNLVLGPKQSNKDRFDGVSTVINSGVAAVTSGAIVITLEAGETEGAFKLKVGESDYLYWYDGNYLCKGAINSDYDVKEYEWYITENGIMSVYSDTEENDNDRYISWTTNGYFTTYKSSTITGYPDSYVIPAIYTLSDISDVNPGGGNSDTTTNPSTADTFSSVVIAVMAVSAIAAGVVISKKKEF